MRVTIIGQGVVGNAVYDLLSTHYDVDFDSPDPCELGVVAVPTPMGSDGRADTSTVRFAVHSLNAHVILIESTVPPGTVDALKEETGKRLVFHPEMVQESSYWHPFWNDNDMREIPWVTLGGDPEDTAYVQDILLPVLGPNKRYIRTGALEAELAKYWENVTFATKVTLFNEFYEIAQAYGADWHEAREALLADPRIERLHTAVFPNDRGFGGKCLPKDLSALIQSSRDAGYDPQLLQQVWDSNQRFRQENDHD